MSATTENRQKEHEKTADTGILREGRCSHVMKDVLASSAETGRAIRHQSLSLSRADLPTQIGLATLSLISTRFHNSKKYLAELAFSAFGGVERNDMVTNLDIGDPLAHRLNNSTSLVSANNREGPFGILSREGIRIGVADLKNC